MRLPLGRQTHELAALARERRITAFIERASGLPPADLADVFIVLLPVERAALVASLPPRLAALGLSAMPLEAHADAILAILDVQHAARVVAELGDDAATDLLGRLRADQRDKILSCLDHRVVLRQLLVYDARSAGGLMTSRVVVVNELDPVALATEAVRRQATAIGDVAEIFVVDTARRLSGVLSVKQLLLASPASLVRDVMASMPVHVAPEEDRGVVARVIARYNLTSVPVLDPGGRLLGRVTAGAVRDVTVDEAAEDLLRFGGVPTRESSGTGWAAVVRGRLPSLYTNLLTAFGAAAVVYFFKDSLLRVITLAVWMPVVAGVGGNAGTQALAASVRRLVLHSVDTRHPGRSVAREAAIGAANGAALGVVVAAVAVLLGEPWRLGLVVLLAMIGNLVLAGAAGAAIPLVLKRLGRDPAFASPVFVTALMDISGFVLLFALASVMLL